MEMNDRVRELIAIGASITANCQPCLQKHVEKAITFGACAEEVSAAIEIGNRVKKGAAARMEAFASNVLPGCDVVLEGNGYQFLGP